MTTEETIARIEKKINKLPLIDSEVVGIITLLNNPASNFEQIAENLSPSLAARFLNIANSAYYGGREVRSINYAVQLLGYAKMKDYLITSILMDHFTRRLKDFNFQIRKHGLGGVVELTSDLVRLPVDTSMIGEHLLEDGEIPFLK